ncbi:radical SAM protein, partial [Micrococcus endophyticus]
VARVARDHAAPARRRRPRGARGVHRPGAAVRGGALAPSRATQEAAVRLREGHHAHPRRRLPARARGRGLAGAADPQRRGRRPGGGRHAPGRGPVHAGRHAPAGAVRRVPHRPVGRAPATAAPPVRHPAVRRRGGAPQDRGRALGSRAA